MRLRFLLLFLTIFSLSIQAQISNDEREKLKNPRQTMRTFMTAMERVKSGSAESFSDAILTIDLSGIDPALRKLTGKVTAEKLINTIDRIAHINYVLIPEHEDGPKWFFRKQTINIGDNIHDVEISIYKTSDGVWKFSPETVSTIENFYSGVSHQKVLEGLTEYRNWRSRITERMPDWTGDEFLMFKKGQWLGFVIILLLSLASFSIIRFFATIFLRFKIEQKSLDLVEEEQFKSTQAFGFLAFSLTWLVGVRQLELDLDILKILSRGSYILTAVFFVWSALTVVDYVSLHFEKMAKKTANKFDDVLVPMLSKATKFLVFCFGALLVAHSLTFDVASILAGLGIGGVAVALAAKDTISNLFGSVTVLMDQPFQLGDYVMLEKGLEGSVEEVGFRSTRIRTPMNSLVTVPNSVLANMAIDNYGMRKVRRFKTKLSLDFNTPVNLIEEFCERIRYNIRMNPLVQTEEQFVTIFEISPSSIEIMISIYLMTNNQVAELSERHKLIVEIIKIADEMGVKFSYPTQTLFVHTENEAKS